MRYALRTHDKLLLEKPSASWMCGSATFTIVVSSTTISWAARMTNRKSGEPDADGAVAAGAACEVEGKRIDFDLSADTVSWKAEASSVYYTEAPSV
jgi:hypothetical protein